MSLYEKQSANKAFSLSDGFTLIELLVVITLMSVVMVLVAPVTVNLVDKAKAQTQYIQLQSTLKKQSQRAFLSASEVQVMIQNNALVFIHPRQGKNTVHFHDISFADVGESFSFNQNGLPNIPEIRVQVSKQLRLLPLTKLWDTRNAL